MPWRARLLEAWITRWRPMLLGDDSANPYLFPGRAAGRPMSASGLRQALVLLVHRRVGLRIHPHLLRHFAAWRHLHRLPGQYEIVRRALGHRSVETTIAFYCGLEGEAAARAFHEALEQDRAEARKLVGLQRRRSRPRKSKVA